MIGFCGYSLCSDGNSVDPAPALVSGVDYIQIQNAIFDDMYVTQDVESDYSTDVPSEWDLYTIMYANFNGTLSAGNLDASLRDLNAIRIKRRELGQGEADWITIKEVPITPEGGTNFSYPDYLAENKKDYEYAWVPVIRQDGGETIEGEYTIKEVQSNFRGVFITDADSIYKFYTGVAYGSNSKVQQVGVFTPLNKEFPVYVTNGVSSYQTGAVQGRILRRYEQSGEFDRLELVEEKEALLEFLTNKRAKMIKDWNGNSWLVFITGNPTVSYDNSYGMGMMNVAFDWSETGKADNASDLQSSGLIPIL